MQDNGGYIYHVDEVGSDFTTGSQILNATLKSGFVNSYRKMLFDKADLLDLIGIGERYQLTDNELDKLLIHRVEHQRDGYPESLSYMRSRKFISIPIIKNLLHFKSLNVCKKIKLGHKIKHLAYLFTIFFCFNAS